MSVRLIVLLALTVFSVLLIAAKNTTPIELLQEGRYGCGYDCLPDDGCIGVDERWGWTARGDLEPGESWTYQPLEPDCGPRHITARAWWKGQQDLTLTLESTGELDVGEATRHRGYRGLEACLHLAATGKHTVTITNNGNKTARDIGLAGNDVTGWSIYEC